MIRPKDGSSKALKIKISFSTVAITSEKRLTVNQRRSKCSIIISELCAGVYSDPGKAKDE